MILILKGLINKKKLLSNLIIMLLLFFLLSITCIIKDYQINKRNIEFEKKAYRTIIMVNVKNTDFLKIYDNLIESHIEISNSDESNKFNIEVIFKSSEDMNYFLNKENNNYQIEIPSVAEVDQNLYLVFKGLYAFLLIAIFILIIIFIHNYHLTLTKDIFLYKILGFNKNKILLFLTAFFNVIYLLLYIISYLTSYLIYYLLYKTRILTIYYNIFNINYLIMISITLSLIISLVISNKLYRKYSDYTVLNGLL